MANSSSAPETPLYLLDNHLLEAAQEGQTDRVESLLDQGANIEIRHERSLASPLHLAASMNRIDVVRVLLDRGALLEARARLDRTPLHWAALENCVEMLPLLIDRGADVEARDEVHQTPLHLAASIGWIDSIQLLLDRGATLEALDKNGDTPLHLAAWLGRIGTMQLLLDRGSRIESGNRHESTPLQRAVQGFDPLAVRWLIAAGAVADRAWANEVEGTPLQTEMSRILRLDRLTAAAEIGHVGLVEGAVQALPHDTSDEIFDQRLRAAARHAMEHDQPKAAAYLQSLLAARAIDQAFQPALTVRPL